MFLPPAGDPFYNATGLMIVGMIRRRFEMSGQPGATWLPPRGRPGGKPLLETNRLMRSVNHLVRRGPSGTSEISVGTSDVRAAIHHFGGEIRPKIAKALFLPLTEKARRIGPRKAGERVIKKVTKDGAETYDALKYGVDFILVGKVTIPARPFLFLAQEQKQELKAFVVHELRARGFGGN